MIVSLPSLHSWKASHELLIYWGIFKVSYLGCDYNFPVLSGHDAAFSCADYLEDRGFGLLLYIPVICLQIRLCDLWSMWLLETCMCFVGVLGQVMKWNNFQKKKGLGHVRLSRMPGKWRRKRWADQLPWTASQAEPQSEQACVLSAPQDWQNSRLSLEPCPGTG